MMLDLCAFLCGVACVSLLLFILLCVVLVKGTAPYPLVQRASEERYFINTAAGNARVDFPSLDDEQSVHLSVVVPAFDEETRLPPMLDECLDFLSARRPAGFLFEVIVVSDGSRDSTASVARKYTARWGPDTVRVLELATNRGKGGAVRLGMMSARGAVLLFADADGATQFCDLAKLEASLKQLVQGRSTWSCCTSRSGWASLSLRSPSPGPR